MIDRFADRINIMSIPKFKYKFSIGTLATHLAKVGHFSLITLQ